MSEEKPHNKAILKLTIVLLAYGVIIIYMTNDESIYEKNTKPVSNYQDKR